MDKCPRCDQDGLEYRNGQWRYVIDCSEHTEEECLLRQLKSANLQAESWCMQATESDLKLKEITERLIRAEKIIEVIKSEYSRETGLLNVPALCRKTPHVGCFCGCHITEIND